MSMLTESQRQIDALSSTLRSISASTTEATSYCDALIRRTRNLSSLTSPASDASALLSQAQHNLTSTLNAMKEAREKFDTVNLHENTIRRLFQGAREAMETYQREIAKKKARAESEGKDYMGGDGGVDYSEGSSTNAASSKWFTNSLTEQDVYDAADAMDAIREAHTFLKVHGMGWQSTPSSLGAMERVHQLGCDAVCLVITARLTLAGPVVRAKKERKDGEKVIKCSPNETAIESRKRLATALQNRDVMKSVGEYEEFLPLDTRAVRELRAVMECLSYDKMYLGESLHDQDETSLQTFMVASNKVVRTEKCGSGSYTNLTKAPLKTGFPHLNAYGETRRAVAFATIDGYYLRTKRDLVKNRRVTDVSMSESGDVDAAARDAIRCLEHAMVIVAGEKSIYRCVISPSSSHTHDETKIPPKFKRALLASYCHVVAAVVDRALDIIETVFFRDAAIAKFDQRPSSSEDTYAPHQTVRATGSAAAAGLRILDGVRMLGPSLAKLCEIADLSVKSGKDDASMTLVGCLCIGIHRTTVKNTAKTLENLAKAIQNDPLEGEKHRPQDARVAAVSSDVVRAIRIISPFVAAYKSVTKRRALPWDQNIGEATTDIDTYVQHLVTALLKNLVVKSKQYAKDVVSAKNIKDTGTQTAMNEAKQHMFMMNNTYYLLEQFGTTVTPDDNENEHYHLENSTWFRQKLDQAFQHEKKKYLAQWADIKKHLSSVDEAELTYAKPNEKLLTLESGRLIKTRFSGFIEAFEMNCLVHKPLTVIDFQLRGMLQNDIKNEFLPKYTRFYEKYSKIQFSKKNMDEYLKYPPALVEEYIDDLYTAH